MTAFDRAWELLKMPIVPHSLIQDEQDEDMYSASFKDPLTEEIIPMKIGLGTGRAYAEIKHPNESLPRSKGSFQNWGDDGENNVYESRGTSTDPRHQRKGYATALYNILAHLLKNKKYDGAIYPSSEELHEDGVKFWNNAYETGKTNLDGSWRGDLYDSL